MDKDDTWTCNIFAVDDHDIMLTKLRNFASIPGAHILKASDFILWTTQQGKNTHICISSNSGSK